MAAPSHVSYNGNVLTFQVLRLLDVVGLPELVIQLATSAITEAGDDWKSQVKIY